MADIVEARHSIGSDASFPVPTTLGKRPNSSSSSSSSSAPPPPQVVRVKSIPVVTAPSKKTAEKEEKEIKKTDRAALFVKVNSYLTSKPLAPYIPAGIKPPSEGASLEVLEATYTQIMNGLKAAYKRRMVMTMFNKGSKTLESIMVNFFQLEHARGLADAMKEQEEDFQPELEELALELDEGLIPGPKVRLGVKMLEFFDDYLSGRHKNPNLPAPSNDGPATNQ